MSTSTYVWPTSASTVSRPQSSSRVSALSTLPSGVRTTSSVVQPWTFSPRVAGTPSKANTSDIYVNPKTTAPAKRVSSSTIGSMIQLSSRSSGTGATWPGLSTTGGTAASAYRQHASVSGLSLLRTTPVCIPCGEGR